MSLIVVKDISQPRGAEPAHCATAKSPSSRRRSATSGYVPMVIGLVLLGKSEPETMDFYQIEWAFL